MATKTMILKKSIILISREGNSDGTRRTDLSDYLPTDYLIELYAQELGSSTNAETLKSLFEDAYLKHDNLADATRQLANSLFWNIRSGNF
jgi:hypothetical protein